MLDTCHMNSVNDLAVHDRVLVAQWIERPLGVREVIRSILVADTEFFIFSLSKARAMLIRSLFARRKWIKISWHGWFSCLHLFLILINLENKKELRNNCQRFVHIMADYYVILRAIVYYIYQHYSAHFTVWNFNDSFFGCTVNDTNI